MINSSNKILFVILDNYKFERLGIQLLSSIALEEGYERELCIINSMPLEEALKKAEAYQPQIVAYSAMTYENTGVQQFNKLLKQSGMTFISIFGGHHYTFNPEEIIRDNNIDALCLGEGEVAFRKFIQAVRDEQEYHQIEKLWVRNGDGVIKNPVGSLISDLDIIPFPDRNLISLDLDKDHMQGKSMAVMFGRGCPHKCSYCFNTNYNALFRDSRILRFRSVNNMIEELKHITTEYDIEIFIFYDDDCFSYLPKKTIKEFCERYKKEIKKPFVAQFRPEKVNEDTVVMLKDAGLFLSPVGVECGNEEVADKVLQRGRVTNKDIIKAFEILNKHSIRTWAMNIMVLPVEDPLSVDLETIKLNIKLKPFWSQFNILVPIPKTPIWDYLTTKGYIGEDSFLSSNKLPSGFTTTTLNFKNVKLASRANNLHKFAGIAVKFPFLLPLVRILILFPPNRLYQYIFLFWYGYWKTIGSYNQKFSLALFFNGIKAIRKYLRRY